MQSLSKVNLSKINLVKVNLIAAALLLVLSSCSKTDNRLLSINIEYDAEQERLDNIGQPSDLPAGNAGQSPEFRDFRIFTIELAPEQWTLPGQGVTIYKAPETSRGGDQAIDFDQMAAITNGEFPEEIILDDIPAGTYEYIRVSVAYQNGDIRFNLINTPLGDLINQQGTISSFLGYNTYIGSVRPNSMELEVNENKLQGFWAFETNFDPPYDAFNDVYSGQSPAGATTVVNPLAGIADIPPGSCIVTGKFDEALVVADTDESINISLSFSINQSFEWIDDGNGEWDIDVANGTVEPLVDMGLRGLKASWSGQ